MICPNCGKEIKETARFCPYCGHSFEAASSGEDTRKSEQEEPVHQSSKPDHAETAHKKKGPKRAVVLFVFAAAAIIGILAGRQVYSSSPTRRAGKQIDLGNIYLQEVNYEEAASAFTLALQIDPDAGEALEGLGNTYKQWGQSYIDAKKYSEAENVLAEGIDTLQNLKTDYNVPADDVITSLTDLKNRAASLREAGEKKAAVEDIVNAYRDNPAAIGIIDNMADLRSAISLLDELDGTSDGNYICPDDGYGFYTAEDGSLMLYIGPYSGMSRNGQGLWIKIVPGKSQYYYYADATWVNDSPDGAFTINYYNLSHESAETTLTGNVKNGLFDGRISLQSGEHSGALIFKDGYVQITKTNGTSGEYTYILSEDDNMTFVYTKEEVNETHGLPGYAAEGSI